MPIFSTITGSGSYIPSRRIPNSHFFDAQFYDEKGKIIEKPAREIVQKFEEVTDIRERRYADEDQLCSDLGTKASQAAISDSGIDPESLDYIIFAHNFGDILHGNRRTDQLPALASRVKHQLGIKNPDCIAYDLPFGCPGWVQAMIQADYYLKAGDARRALIIGAETLSRIIDPHDRDSMIFADGAGAVILEGQETDQPQGILSHKTRTDTSQEAYFLYMDESFNPDFEGDDRFVKMQGRQVFRYAVSQIPGLVKTCLEKANVGLTDIKKLLVHQANPKMDWVILAALFKQYGHKDLPDGIMPLTAPFLGNSSVATVPTLYDLISHGQLEDHQFSPGDHVVMASVGAGMHVNALVYRFPGVK